MPHTSAGGYGIGRVIMRNCSLVVLVAFGYLCVIHLFKYWQSEYYRGTKFHGFLLVHQLFPFL